MDARMSWGWEREREREPTLNNTNCKFIHSINWRHNYFYWLTWPHLVFILLTLTQILNLMSTLGFVTNHYMVQLFGQVVLITLPQTSPNLNPRQYLSGTIKEDLFEYRSKGRRIKLFGKYSQWRKCLWSETSSLCYAYVPWPWNWINLCSYQSSRFLFFLNTNIIEKQINTNII